MFKRKYPLMDDAPGAAGGGVAAPAAPAAPGAPAAPAAPAPAWFESFTNPELKQWVQAAGVPDPEQAAAKAWNLEKMMGADRVGRTVVLPADMNDQTAMAAVFDKLGRPPTPDAYKLDVPEGGDAEFVKTAAAWFHGAGLTQSQAQNVAKAWNEYAGKAVADQQAAEAAALAAEHAALAKDWGTGPAADGQREMARRAAVKLGMDETAISALEKVAGFSKVMKAFAKMGELLGEGKSEGFGEGGTFGTTPEQAKGRKAQLMADGDWRKRAMQPNSAEWAELQRLDQIIAANLPAFG